MSRSALVVHRRPRVRCVAASVAPPARRGAAASLRRIGAGRVARGCRAHRPRCTMCAMIGSGFTDRYLTATRRARSSAPASRRCRSTASACCSSFPTARARCRCRSSSRCSAKCSPARSRRSTSWSRWARTSRWTTRRSRGSSASPVVGGRAGDSRIFNHEWARPGDVRARSARFPPPRSRSSPAGGSRRPSRCRSTAASSTTTRSSSAARCSRTRSSASRAATSTSSPASPAPRSSISRTGWAR